MRCEVAYEKYVTRQIPTLKEAAQSEGIGEQRMHDFIRIQKPPPREPLPVALDGSIDKRLELQSGETIWYKYYPRPYGHETRLRAIRRYSFNFMSKRRALRSCKKTCEEQGFRLRKERCADKEQEASEYDSETERGTVVEDLDDFEDALAVDSPSTPSGPTPWVRGELRSAVMRAATSADESFIRTRSLALGPVADTLPHESAGLDKETASWIKKYKPWCTCSTCDSRADYGIKLGRAMQLESGKAAMYGSSAFIDYPPSQAVLRADAQLDKTCKPPRVIKVDCCERCHTEGVLTVSRMRSEAAALDVWRDELDLDSLTERMIAGALRVPHIELAPTLNISLVTSTAERRGKHTVALALSEKDVLVRSAALTRLWGRRLTSELLSNYRPLIINENLVTELASEAANSLGAEWAKREVGAGNIMLMVVQMPEEAIRHAGATLDPEVQRDCLKASAVSNILVPNGHSLDKETEAFANRFEASLFHGGVVNCKPENIRKSFFVRAGKAAGPLDAHNAVERLGQHYDVRQAANNEWASHVDFLCATDASDSVRAVAMGYIAGEGAHSRKQRSTDGSSSKSLSGDGIGQPRLVRLYPPIRGMEIDDDALSQICEQSKANPGGLADQYIERVRMPQTAAMADALLTMRHNGFGMQPLADGQAGNPLVKASSTVVRVFADSTSVEWAHAYFAVNGTTAVNCQGLAIHVDGAARRKEPTAELLSTRWADSLSTLSHHQSQSRLEGARSLQPLLSMLVCLRRGLAIDVTPCSGILISAGTEDEHGVPQPDEDLHGMTEMDLERGFTRSYATSLRPDAQGEHDLPFVGDGRRAGLRSAAAQPQPRQVPAGNRPQRAVQPVQRYAPNGGAANNIVGNGAGQVPYRQLNAALQGGWGAARINRNTGNAY